MISFSIEVRLFPPPTGEVGGVASKLKRPAPCFFPSGKVTAGPGVKRAQQVHLPVPPVANSTSSFVPLVWRLHGDAVFFFSIYSRHIASQAVELHSKHKANTWGLPPSPPLPPPTPARPLLCCICMGR